VKPVAFLFFVAYLPQSAYKSSYRIASFRDLRRFYVVFMGNFPAANRKCYFASGNCRNRWLFAVLLAAIFSPRGVAGIHLVLCNSHPEFGVFRQPKLALHDEGLCCNDSRCNSYHRRRRNKLAKHETRRH
jgi:hypothetical protein